MTNTYIHSLLQWLQNWEDKWGEVRINCLKDLKGKKLINKWQVQISQSCIWWGPNLSSALTGVILHTASVSSTATPLPSSPNPPVSTQSSAHKPTCKQSLTSGNPFLLSNRPLFWSLLRISGLTALMSIFRLAVGVHGSPWEISLGLVGVVKGPKSGWISANTIFAAVDSFRGVFISPLLCGSKKRFSWFKTSKLLNPV